MKIISLEDDEPFWDLLKDELETKFPNVSLQWIRTEADFYDRIGDFVANPPDLFILDVMVKWADPVPEMPEPPENVEREKYYRAGLRCRKRLLERPATASVPVILLTVLEQVDMDKVAEDIPAGTVFVAKSSDFRELIDAIKKLCRAKLPSRLQQST
jgi:DNA-binding response OmpR family regulator